MLRYVSVAAKRVFGLQHPGRRLTVRADDILLASHPDPSDSWIHTLIADLLFPEAQVTATSLHKFILDPYLSVKRDFDRAPRPRIIKSHGCFDPRFHRVLYIVRDPRPLVLSHYQHLRSLRRIDDKLPIERFVDDFVSRQGRRSAGSWGENVGTWLAARSQHPGFLLLRYEDLLSNPAGELTRVAIFAGLQEVTERVARAIGRSAAEKTRESQTKQGGTQIPSEDMQLDGWAQSAGWQTELPGPLVARIEAAWGDIMAGLEYPLATGDARSVSHSSLISSLTSPNGRQKADTAALPAGPSVSASLPGKTPAFRRLMRASRQVLGRTSLAGHFEIYDDDVFLVSFPKSGNTWTRFLIANLVHPEERVDFSNIDLLVPESENLTRNEVARVSRPRIMKSHAYFDPRYPKVIYIVRDPRDVVVSQFHFYRKRRRIGDDYSIEQFVTRFVAGDTSDYGSWGDNVATWLVTRQKSADFLLLRYEDLLAQTASELQRIAQFLRLETTPALISQAVERSSAKQMRKLESPESTAIVTKNTRQDIPFVRAAEAGGWMRTLSEKSLIELESAWAPIMKWLGYEPARVSAVTSEDARVPKSTGPK
jgi:hypothetical protein